MAATSEHECRSWRRNTAENRIILVLVRRRPGVIEVEAVHSVPEGLQPGRVRTPAHRVCHSPNRGGIIGTSLDESKCRARPLAPLAAGIPPGTFGPWEDSTQGANGGRYPSRPAHEARHTGRGAPGLRGRGRKLCSPNLDVAVQEISGSGAGRHWRSSTPTSAIAMPSFTFIGKAAGAVPEGPAVAALLAEYPDLGARCRRSRRTSASHSRGSRTPNGKRL